MKPFKFSSDPPCELTELDDKDLVGCVVYELGNARKCNIGEVAGVLRTWLEARFTEDETAISADVCDDRRECGHNFFLDGAAPLLALDDPELAQHRFDCAL